MGGSGGEGQRKKGWAAAKAMMEPLPATHHTNTTRQGMDDDYDDGDQYQTQRGALQDTRVEAVAESL